MFLTRFRYRAAGVDAADSNIFVMRNPPGSGRRISIPKLILTVGFDGTSAAAEVGYGLRRCSGANPTGGSSPGRTKTRNTDTRTSIVLDANIKEGAVLTVAGISFEAYFHEAVIPATQGAVLSHIIDFFEGYELGSGEGLAISNTLATVAGTSASGFVLWEEIGT